MDMVKKGLTISIIMQAQSANYGESVGNISILKKMTRADGKVYTYISRQALRYSIVHQMGIDTTEVDSGQGVVQFSPDTTIVDSPEIDLFGYMKTKKKETKSDSNKTLTRSAVVRLSNAISLEPYRSDIDFLNNMGLAKRAGLENAIAQSEIHNSLYAYTLTADLDRIGKDDNDGKDISNKEKAERIINLLDTVQFLYRDIRGRRENLSPVFVIGGVYGRKHPYFEDRLRVSKNSIETEIIKDIISSCDDTKDNTVIGCLDGFFDNGDKIKELGAKSISETFSSLKSKVVDYYG